MNSTGPWRSDNLVTVLSISQDCGLSIDCNPKSLGATIAILSSLYFPKKTINATRFLSFVLALQKTSNSLLCQAQPMTDNHPLLTRSFSKEDIASFKSDNVGITLSVGQAVVHINTCGNELLLWIKPMGYFHFLSHYICPWIV